MSVTPLRRQVLRDRVVAARAEFAAARSVPPTALATVELKEAVGELAALESQVAALRMSCAAEADSAA